MDSPGSETAGRAARKAMRRPVGWQSRPSTTHSCLHLTYDNNVAALTGKYGVDPIELIW
jgi:hypothetical protein